MHASVHVLVLQAKAAAWRTAGAQARRACMSGVLHAWACYAADVADERRAEDMAAACVRERLGKRKATRVLAAWMQVCVCSKRCRRDCLEGPTLCVVRVSTAIFLHFTAKSLNLHISRASCHSAAGALDAAAARNASRPRGISTGFAAAAACLQRVARLGGASAGQSCAVRACGHVCTAAATLRRLVCLACASGGLATHSACS